MVSTTLLFVLALTAIVCVSSQPSIYSIVTEFVNDNSATAQYLVKIDAKTGQVENLAQTYLFLGGSITVDGYSTFDPKRSVYYYATNAGAGNIFEANAAEKRLLAPISMYAKEVNNIAFDTQNDRLITAFTNEKGESYLVAFPVGMRTKWTEVLQFNTTEVNMGFVSAAAVDSDSQTYYLLAKQGPKPELNYALYKTSLTSTGSALTGTLLDCSTPVFPEYVSFDPTSKMLVGYAKDQKLGNYYMTVTTGGKCELTPISIPTKGIVTCSSYDPKGAKLYLGQATNEGARIYTYDTATKTIESSVIAPKYSPESLEVAYP